jgi:hypothetical protein
VTTEGRTTLPRHRDPDLDLRRILWLTVALVSITCIAAAAAWLLLGAFSDRALRSTPAPSPLEAARERAMPPDPVLQTDPRRDLLLLREAEERLLESYGATDSGPETARVPIARAMELLIETGLDPWSGRTEAVPSARAEVAAPPAPTGTTP